MNELNSKIVECHNPGLIDNKKSPNENIIYHLYSDGTVTYQKGGDVYGQRSMFDLYPRFYYFDSSLLTFPLKANDGTTYAILTEEQCINFRNQMKNLGK